MSEDIEGVLRKGCSVQYPKCTSQSFSEMELMGGVKIVSGNRHKGFICLGSFWHAEEYE